MSKILISLVSFNENKKEYLSQVLDSYIKDFYNHDVTFVLSINYEFDYPTANIVKLPKEYNDWNYTWNNKRYVLENCLSYDYVIESDDDVILDRAAFEYYIQTQKYLKKHGEGKPFIAGFNVYEVKQDIRYIINAGLANDTISNIHYIGNEIFLEFTNYHSACYLMDRESLERVIKSLPSTPCQGGIYGLPEWSITSAYLGSTKVIPLSEVNRRALVKHLPNKYVNQIGQYTFPTADQLSNLEFCKMYTNKI
jgi:hypothetical protein